MDTLFDDLLKYSKEPFFTDDDLRNARSWCPDNTSDIGVSLGLINGELEILNIRSTITVGGDAYVYPAMHLYDDTVDLVFGVCGYTPPPNEYKITFDEKSYTIAREIYRKMPYKNYKTNWNTHTCHHRLKNEVGLSGLDACLYFAKLYLTDRNYEVVKTIQPVVYMSIEELYGQSHVEVLLNKSLLHLPYYPNVYFTEPENIGSGKYPFELWELSNFISSFSEQNDFKHTLLRVERLFQKGVVYSSDRTIYDGITTDEFEMFMRRPRTRVFYLPNS